MRNILFICTGNYYRSRFCELYFNHLASIHNVPAVADSAALLRDLSDTGNEGAIAKEVLDKLSSLGAQLESQVRFPKIAKNKNIINASKVIAVSRAEHTAMVQKYFSEHADFIEYYEVEDVPIMDVEEALELLTHEVESLIKRLQDTISV